jgi:hypothetical protein
MSSLLFRIDKRNNTILDKQAAKLTQHCKKLSEEELRYVILVADYYSPLKQYPKKEKAIKAERMVWGTEAETKQIGEDPKIKRAIEEYEELQYDPIRETIKAYREKVNSLVSELLLANRPGKVSQIDADIQVLQTRIAEMQEDIQKAEDAVKLKKKGDSLSLIEIWQRNIEQAKKDKMQMNKKKLELEEKDVHSED